MTERQREAVARAIWNVMSEYEDRCDTELEDIGDKHRVWEMADAAMRALPAAAAPSGWQPIESFPKTLRFGEGENCYSAYALVWNAGMPCPVRAKWWWRTDGDACNFIADGNYAVFPSHWQPLPAAPDA